MSDENKADYYSELTEVQKKILEKELEVESIADRVTILMKTEWGSDNLHKANVKHRFEKSRLVELRCKEVEITNKIALSKWTKKT